MADDKSEFDKADSTFSADDPVEVTAIVEHGEKRVVAPANMIEHRQNLVRQHFKGADGLADRLKATGRDNSKMLVMALVEEVVSETDHLLGNEMIATQDGNLRDASIISFKRVESLEKAIKAVQTKQELDGDHGIDVTSPAVTVMLRFFMKKVKDAFSKMGVHNEMTDSFFRTLGDVMANWQKELAADLDELDSIKPSETHVAAS